VEVSRKVVDLLQIQPGGNMGRFDNRRSRTGGYRGLHGSGHFGGRFTTVTEMRPDFVGEIVVKCAGMRFLVRNTQPRQVLEDHITLHFQFTRQFVNPNLPHA
jgi:hypothetical protein